MAKKFSYESPQVQLISLAPEGIFCQSRVFSTQVENMSEDDYEWEI